MPIGPGIRPFAPPTLYLEECQSHLPSISPGLRPFKATLYSWYDTNAVPNHVSNG
jgi:hypothetical protein